MKPLIIVNFKTYPQALGDKGISLARTLASVKSKNFTIAVAPTLLTMREITVLPIAVFAQHADPVRDGPHTGSVSVRELKKMKVKGVILNHSEQKIALPFLKQTIGLCRKEKLTTVVCASTLEEVKRIAPWKPDYIAYEPPELIGGEVSVTTAEPRIIGRAVKLMKHISPSTNVLCGAGVHTAEDVRTASQLGCQGVLVSHAIVNAKKPAEALREILIYSN
ncbi:MAG: triose-phosphate isomerase [Nanoarchaeota archaeon]